MITAAGRPPRRARLSPPRVLASAAAPLHLEALRLHPMRHTRRSTAARARAAAQAYCTSWRLRGGSATAGGRTLAAVYAGGRTLCPPPAD